ncbi:MAG: protoheme IX farnesyltransferase [Chloroflexi bacterium]|nr:protoheme IX farnesyltransferase [Chloroflexota bacterium]
MIAAYVSLTKPRIIVLLLLTTLAAMYVADPRSSWSLVFFTMVGGYLAAGGANAINQYVDRDIDELMSRTRHRSLPSGRIKPQQALVFGLVLSVLSFVVYTTFVNLLSAVLALSGILCYVFVYTLSLKRSTPQNIVIGGAAGAIPPVVGWAAATGTVELPALYLFAIIFFWTPPHFWALALLMQDEYKAANIPMLPVVAGERETVWQILLYTIVLIAVTLLPATVRVMGLVYLISAALLGAGFLFFAWQLFRAPSRRKARQTFAYSMAYLALLFLAMVADRALLS